MNAQVAARSVLDDTMERKAKDQAFTAEVDRVFTGLLQEMIPQEVRLCVEEAVREQVQAYMDQKKKQEAQNPLLRLIHDIIDEGVRDGCRGIVVETINEEVDEHLLQMRCRVAFDSLVSDILIDYMAESFDTLVLEVAEELVCDDLLYEVADEYSREETVTFLDGIQRELEEAKSLREKRAVAEAMKEVVVKRLLLAYLMNSISDKFATVQVFHLSRHDQITTLMRIAFVQLEYFARAQVERMLAARLVSLVQGVQNTLSDVVKVSLAIIKYFI